MLRPLAAAVLAITALAVTALAAPALAQERGARPPPGDYFETCRNISTFGYGRDATITAECRDRDGRWRRTSLQFAGCDRIHNRDGQLVCRGDDDRPGGGYGPGPGGPGGGGYGGGFGGRPRITLFAQPNFGGRPFFSDSEVTNLPREFNDRALSLRIEGRRAWQICVDSDFRGRCVVVDRDVPDLRSLGMAFSISSMRPIR